MLRVHLVVKLLLICQGKQLEYIYIYIYTQRNIPYSKISVLYNKLSKLQRGKMLVYIVYVQYTMDSIHGCKWTELQIWKACSYNYTADYGSFNLLELTTKYDL